MAEPLKISTNDGWAQAKLELAVDPYSNPTPGYSDVTEDLQEIEWWGGRANDFDDPQTGGMTCRLRNTNRRYEPEQLSSSVSVTAAGNEVTDAVRAANASGDARTRQPYEFMGGFENGDEKEWQQKQEFAAGRLTFVTTPTDSSHYAGRFEVRDGDTVASGNRLELMNNLPRWVNNDEAYYGLSVYFPSTWNDSITGTQFKIVAQWKDSADLGPPNFAMRVANGNINLTRNAGTADGAGVGTSVSTDTLVSGFPKGVWLRFVLHFRWRTASTGVAEVWYSAGGAPYQQVYTGSGFPTLLTTGAGAVNSDIYVKAGLYRNIFPETYTDVLYHDNYCIGSSFQEVAYGMSSPDSSYGIFAGTTNQALYGNAQDTTDWIVNGAATVTQQNSPFVFAGASSTRAKIDTTGAGTGEGVRVRRTGLSEVGLQYWNSLYCEREPGQSAVVVKAYTILNYSDATSDTGAVQNYILGDFPLRLYAPPVTANGAKTVTSNRIAVETTGAAQVRTFYAGGAMLEAGTGYTPYVHTNGASASRSASRVRLPVTSISGTQGWVGFLARMFDSNDDVPSATPYGWRIRVTDSDEIRVRYDTAAKQWVARRVAAGTGTNATAAVSHFPRGGFQFVLVSWTSTQIKISVDGVAFVTAADTNLPNLSTATFDVGSNQGSSLFLSGDVKWIAWGTGTLSDADATSLNVLARKGSDPLPLDFPSSASLIHTWNASSSESRTVDTVRFRFTLTDATGAAQQGIYYFDSFDIEYPTGKTYSEVVFTNTCGMGLLAAEPLPAFSPAESSSYEDVIDYSEPSFYYRLGEEEGTKLVAHSKRKRRRGEKESKRHYRRHGIRHWKTRETKADVEGVSGPAGTYKNTPTLGESGGITGDTDTAVRFVKANLEYARVPVDVSDLIDTNRLSVEAWVNADSLSGTSSIVSGPPSASNADGVFRLALSGGLISFDVHDAAGGTTTATTLGAISTGTWYHIVATWTGVTASIYANGVLVFQTSGARVLATGSANEYLYIGTDATPTTDSFDGRIDEVAIYEKAIEPATILNHYTAGSARGYGQELTGTRIMNILTDPLWSETKIAPGIFQMQPRFMNGQPKLEAVIEAVLAESPRSHFYFDGAGDPVFKDWDDTPATSSATWGETGGETHYQDIAVIYDNEVYNEVKGSTDGGETLTVSNTASKSDRRPRVRDEELGLPLANDVDVNTIISTILDEWDSPIMRPNPLAFTATDTTRIDHALRREIGEWVRVKKLGDGGTPIDRQCVILGYRKAIGKDRVLRCSYDLSRGFDASVITWRLGMTGYDELGTNTVLA